MITSAGNAKVKNVIQLQKRMKVRKEQDVFVAEGLKMFAETPPERIRELYVTADFLREHQDILVGFTYEVVDQRIFAQMSDTKTPQGVLCVVRQFHHQLAGMLGSQSPLLLMLEDLQDPGNVGTIFRTAEGAGVDGILLTKNCVDIYNPKTIRSTMGSIYRVPFLYIEDMAEALFRLKERDIRTYAAHLQGQQTYDREDYQGGTAFLIGNEGNGLSEHLAGAADCLIQIPMEGQLESLNAAVAAAILMYEVHRQRNK